MSLVSFQRLVVLRDEALACRVCDLEKTRTNVVFGVGSASAPPVAFVGEAPGENEDLQGAPFVGKAGNLLTKLINAMGYTRDHVYITNTLLCRPPNNRKPLPEELASCSRFLEGQLLEVRPKVIVVLGATAAQTLLRTDESIGKLRGRWFEWNGIPVRATYHPSYLLRDPGKRPLTYEDLGVVVDWLREH